MIWPRPIQATSRRIVSLDEVIINNMQSNAPIDGMNQGPRGIRKARGTSLCVKRIFE